MAATIFVNGVIRSGWGAALLCSALCAAAQPAQRTAASCVSSPEQLRERVSELNAPDPMRRLASLNGMLASCDPAQREVAFERGFASSEQVMRALAMRTKLQSAKVLMLRLSPLNDKDAVAQKLIGRLGDQIAMRVTSFDADTGDLRMAQFISRVSGTKLDLAYGHCSGSMSLADGVPRLAGNLTCARTPVRGEIPL